MAAEAGVAGVLVVVSGNMMGGAREGKNNRKENLPMFRWISDLFLKVFRAVKSILKAVFTAAFQLLLERLKDIATESITKLATADLSSSEKREQAFKEIKAYALQKALFFNDRDISLVIEIIYSQLRNDGIIK